MNKVFINNIGDLAETQKASFYRFLIKGLREELSNFPNPFSSKIQISGRKKSSCLIYLYPENLKLKGPVSSIETCLSRGMTYSIQLYVPAEYSYTLETPINKKGTKILKNKEVRIKQDIFFGEIPLMTEEGTFIISGCERIIISQIIRSPGIYFRKEYSNTRKPIYTATIISNRGVWTKIILDQQEDKKTKLISKHSIYLKLNDFKSNLNNNKEKGFEEDNIIYLYDILRYFGLSFEELSDSLKYPAYLANQELSLESWQTQNDPEIDLIIKKKFFNRGSGTFFIGEIGRYKINKKLGINLPKDTTYITSHDIIGIIDGLMELKYHDRLSDDIDHIKNKQIRCVGDLLQNQIRVGLSRLQKNLIEESPISNSQKLISELETDSSLENVTVYSRLLTTSIKEFFKTSQLSQFMDQTNPLAELTHKRRISVFGPNGLKRDHISTVIRDIHPSQYGRLCPIETPEGQSAGLITSLSLMGRVGSLNSIETPYFLMENSKVFANKRAIFLNPEQESSTSIGFSDINLNDNNIILKKYLSVKENYLFLLKKTKDINFITTSPLQIISLATSLIPFIEHDDANRALMGSNMQRQAVPLLYTQKPIVGTGVETTAIIDSGMVIKSFCEGTVESSTSSSIVIKDLINQKITYLLKKYYRSNQETCLNQRPIVWPGEKVYSGQIIADGPSTNDGELSLGRNLTIAYMPWEGYNYEDAVVINERLILEDCLTSVHIQQYETNLTSFVTGNEKLTKDLPNRTKYVRRHLNKDGIVKIGSYVKEHDILVGKLTPCEEDPSIESKLLRALYNQKDQNYRDTSLKVSHGKEGRVIDVRIISTTVLNDDSTTSITYEIIRIYIAQIRKIKIGDKVAGRHGNKGIVSRILPSQDMPLLPDGTPVDIIFNPLGVPSRMNVGQIFECLLGLAGENLGTRFKITPFDEVYGREASRILTNQKLKEACLKTNSNWLFNNYYPGKLLLRDGRTGEFFDNPITVGKTYILKLIHLVENKIHARATGPYSMITEQPLAGKAHKGGQRFGEMEVWALEAYGCSNTLQELLTIKSDDIDGRNDMYQSILNGNDTKKPTPSIPDAFVALIRELHALGLNFSFKKFENKLKNKTPIKEINRDIFLDLEIRLKLRSLLARKNAEQQIKASSYFEQKEVLMLKKIEEKRKILQKFHNNEI